MNTLLDIAKVIKKQKSIAIACHFRPDGDTIGSTVALKMALDKLGIKSQAFCDDIIPKKYNFLGAEKLFQRKLNNGYECYIVLDCADISRIGDNNADFLAKKTNTINIDHHVSNTRFCSMNYVFENSSNCENIFELIKILGVDIDKAIAEYLLLGIITDTGCFRHKNVTPNTLKVASIMIEKGADINKIYYNTFSKQSKARAKLFGIVMNNLRYFLDDKLCIGTVTQKALLETGALLEDTEGFIDFIMGIDTVDVGICISDMGNNKYKCSFRSKSTDVNQVASIFGGGGHILASGCQIIGEYEDIIDKLRYAVKQYMKED